MATLYETLADAQNGQVMAAVGREFGLSPEQTQSAVAALLPAISMGLKRATQTPDGLAGLLALMGQQQDLHDMYHNPDAAFSRQGRAAGNEVLSAMFGSPEASRAVADHAQQLSGVTSTILKKLLPVIVGILISGLMRSGSGRASPSPTPQPAPDSGGALGDILKEIFTKGIPGAPTPSPTNPKQSPTPSGGGNIGDKIGPGGSGYRVPAPGDTPVSRDPGDQPGDDPLAQIMRELAKAIEEGRLKPVVIGPYEINVPGQGGDASAPQAPGGEILGQILREVLGGSGKQGAGQAVFGNRLDAGQDLDAEELDSLQQVFARFVSD
jgi:hypothetical protein